MKQRTGLFAAIAVVVVIVVIAVIAMAGGKKTTSPTSNSKSSSSSSETSVTDAVATTNVTIQNYAFSPKAIKVKVGDTVTWTNMDEVHHNVVADHPSADAPNGPLIGKGETYSFKFTKAGTYTFYCQPHPYMHGVVQVTN